MELSEAWQLITLSDWNVDKLCTDMRRILALISHNYEYQFGEFSFHFGEDSNQNGEILSVLIF